MNTFKLFLYGLFGGIALALLINKVYAADPIITDNTSTTTTTTNGKMETTVKSPPPSAISPQFSSGSNSDLCTVGASGAVQTQILGISIGSTFTEENCIRLKNAKTLYDMGMKVAAVSVMCQDKKVFDAMMNAGTPCPYKGLIGNEAKLGWETDKAVAPTEETDEPTAEDKRNQALGIIGGIFGTALFF